METKKATIDDISKIIRETTILRHWFNPFESEIVPMIEVLDFVNTTKPILNDNFEELYDTIMHWDFKLWDELLKQSKELQKTLVDSFNTNINWNRLFAFPFWLPNQNLVKCREFWLV